MVTESVQMDLVRAAREAAKQAWCPYSHYPVGAAILAGDGTVHTGCNIENASYGLTNCAERTAIFKAVSSGIRSFQALAIVGGEEEPAKPCGACRQVMAEFCGAEMPVLIGCLRGDLLLRTTVGELLPLSFSPRNLKR